MNAAHTSLLAPTSVPNGRKGCGKYNFPPPLSRAKSRGEPTLEDEQRTKTNQARICAIERKCVPTRPHSPPHSGRAIPTKTRVRLGFPQAQDRFSCYSSWTAKDWFGLSTFSVGQELPCGLPEGLGPVSRTGHPFSARRVLHSLILEPQSGPTPHSQWCGA